MQRQPWLDAGTSIDQGSQRMRHLQHGEIVVSLPNSEGNGFARQPFLLLGALVGLALPLRTRQNAAHLAQHVDTGDLAKAERLHEIMDGLHTHFMRQRIVVNVAGHDDAAAQVDGAQRMAAAEAVIAIHPVAGVINGGGRIARPRFKGRQGHEWFVGGTRRIRATQGAIEQGLVNRFIERCPVFLINAVNEQVAIESGFAHHRKNLPVAWIHGHQGATPVPEQVFHQLLQPDVDGQRDIASRNGRLAGQPAHHLTGGSDFQLFAARNTMQLGFITLLNAKLADMGGSAVVECIVAFFQRAFFFRVDAPDIANHMTGQVGKGVAAIQPGIDFNAGEFMAPRGQPGNFLVAETVAQGDGLIVLAVLAQAVETPPICIADGNDGGQCINGGLHIGYLLWNQLQRIC